MSHFSKGTQDRTTKMFCVAKTHILEGEQKKNQSLTKNSLRLNNFFLVNQKK